MPEEEVLNQEESQDSSTPGDWLKWLEAQPTAVQQQYESHVKGLKSALDAERAKAKEAMKMQKRLTELEEKEKKLKEAELTEMQKLQTQLSELQGSYAQLESALTIERLQRQIVTAATKLGFIDPDDAYHFIDPADVEVEEGRAKNIEDLLKDIAKKKPYLVKSQEEKKTPGSPQKDKLRPSSSKVEVPAPHIKF